MVINARSYIHACGAIWDVSTRRTRGARTRRAKRSCSEAAKAGFGEYRAHLDYMDLAAGTYSFGDHAYRRFLEKIKDAVDPNGILAPGKQWIWPASYRRNGQTPGGCPMSKRLEGKVALITGTGGGQGRAAAVKFAAGGRAGRRLRPLRGGQPRDGRDRGGRRRHDDRDGSRRSQRP